ncbi:MAG TPA: hypothetical protein PKN33_02570 [Phycisphaerae bacterium]|nr:hypothetical protein [Phycisphaerae bacterium]
MSTTSANWPDTHCDAVTRCDALAMPHVAHRLRLPIVWTVALVVVVAGLWFMPGRASIAPRIEQDNAYIYLAVDRLCDGHGLTSIPPKAPFQPWQWHGDWAVLTQWPAGYPLLIAAARMLLGTTTAQAAIALNVFFCGIALVAWFALVRACLPRGLAAWMLALVASASSVSMELLIHPSSDTILVAMVPVVLLLAIKLLRCESVKPAGDGSESIASLDVKASGYFILGIVAGSLVWIRYAAVFVPAAIGAFLLFDWLMMHRRTLRDVALFAMSAGLPMIALVAFNRILGDGVSTQEQFNLGNRFGFDFSTSMIATAWTHWTSQTLYAYRPEAKWLFVAGLPIAALVGPMLFSNSRSRLLALFKNQRMQLAVMFVVALVTVLVTASTLFKGKFHYVGLARYYEPIKPIYFLMFVGPFLVWKHRIVRGSVVVVSLLAVSWFVQQDAMRTRDRWVAADRPFTEYGRWDHRFGPESRELYQWVGKQAAANTVVFSNFHDDIALETGTPVSPAPENAEALRIWLETARKVRNVNHLRAIFVFEFDDDSRDYFQPRPEILISDLGLVRDENAPEGIKKYVFVPDSDLLAGIQNPS